MGLSVCPSAIVAAPVETVWSLLDPLSQLDKWADGEVISIEPEGPATLVNVRLSGAVQQDVCGT